MGKSLLKVRQIDGLQAELSSLQTNISALQNQLGNSVRIYGNGFSTYPVNAELLDGIDLGKYDIIRLRIGNYTSHTVTLSNHQGEGEYGKEWYVFLYNGAGNTCTVKVEDSYSQQRTVSVKTTKSIVIAFTKVEDTKFMVNYIYNINDTIGNSILTDTSLTPFTYSIVCEGGDIFKSLTNPITAKNGEAGLDGFDNISKKITAFVEIKSTEDNLTLQTSYLNEMFGKEGVPDGQEVSLILNNVSDTAKKITYRGTTTVSVAVKAFTRLDYVYFNNCGWLVKAPATHYSAT